MHIVLRFVYLENVKRESSDQQREAEERGCAASEPSVSNLERGRGTCSPATARSRGTVPAALVDIVRVKQFTALDAARLRAALIGMFEGSRQHLFPDAPICDRCAP